MRASVISVPLAALIAATSAAQSTNPLAAGIDRLTTEILPQVVTWRRDFHQHPELGNQEHRTAKIIADTLTKLGYEVKTGVAHTGVVAVLKGAKPGPVVALRADMDALPVTEQGDLPFKSTQKATWNGQEVGVMHACGHDNHMAMLLGAASIFARVKTELPGTIKLIFQPAEEGGAGGKAMVADGLMERWSIQEVYGMHNMPGLAIGRFATRPGAVMAATDEFTITVTGHGGHAARPHITIDPIVVGTAIVQALQTIVSRSIDPVESAVVSVTKFQAGSAYNIIAPNALLAGTVRTLKPEMRDLIESRMRRLVENVAAAHGATVDLHYYRNYPVTRNHAKETEFAASVAGEIVGPEQVAIDAPPLMGGEDFSYMLEARPGAFIFIGNGDSAGLHNPAYDFNDEAIPVGCSYWARLVETAMPA